MQAAVVVTFTSRWIKGPGPLRISVVVERQWSGYLSHKGVNPYVGAWSANVIASQLVERACLLLRCRPSDLRLRLHPADGFIHRVLRHGY